MVYSYISSESQDGYDYMFYANKTGRIYTVTFDYTLYSNYVDELPTLLNEGFGMVFSFDQAVAREKGVSMVDPSVCETISAIISHFLESRGNSTFLVYQCEEHKDNLFENWYDESPIKGHYEKIGVSIEIPDMPTAQVIGFITSVKNKAILQAAKELLTFSIKFMA